MQTQFTEQESLATIQNMIDNAQRRFQEKGEIAILWGWLVFATSILHFVMIKFQLLDPAYVWTVWPVMSVIGLFFQYRIIKKKKQVQESMTYQDRSMIFIWSGIMILYLFTLVLVFSGQINWSVTYGFFLVIFGMGSFITGGLIKSTPFIIGGLLGVPIGILAVYTSNEYILLLMALGMLCFNLIPGYMLKSANSSS
jgi:hypothetical protein